MKPPVETVRVSERGRDILIKLKRKTGIEHWNVLCRWALAESLSRKEKPDRFICASESNIEIKWNTFGGEHADLYSLAVQLSHLKTPQLSLQEFFRAHLERGLLLLQMREDLTSFADSAAG
jgi:DNA sulfur modification protein DndE